MLTVAVTGATGLIGRAVVTAIRGRGWRPLALGRQPVSGVETRAYDLLAPVPAGLLDGVDALVHAAYAPAQRGDDGYRVNLEAAERLLAAARDSHVGRWIYLSSLSARPEAGAAYGRHKLAVERLVAAQPGGVSVRAGLVLGDGGSFGRLTAHLERGWPIPIIDGGRQPVQPVAVADLAAALATLAETRIGGALHAADPTATPFREFVQHTATALGVRARFVPLPFALARVIVWSLERVGAQAPGSSHNLVGLREARVVDSRRDLAVLGIAPRPVADLLAFLDPERRSTAPPAEPSAQRSVRSIR